MVIYATSSPREAFAMGNEILLLANQQKLQAGPILDLYQNPISKEAADLFSEPSVNLIPASSGQISHAQLTAVRPEHVRITDRRSPLTKKPTLNSQCARQRLPVTRPFCMER